MYLLAQAHLKLSSGSFKMGPDLIGHLQCPRNVNFDLNIYDGLRSIANVGIANAEEGFERIKNALEQALISTHVHNALLPLNLTLRNTRKINPFTNYHLIEDDVVVFFYQGPDCFCSHFFCATYFVGNLNAFADIQDATFI